MAQPATVHDLLVVGGGINGAGIARDAAGRGLATLLVEADDLASGTSSASTKLIHGGLRYLEYYEFALVRKALVEREVLLRLAPHIIWPLRFILPHDASQRPAWMLRAGLFLYDHLAGRQRLGASRALRLDRDPTGALIKPQFKRAFDYADCWVDDARLVVLNAMDARARGATVLTRTELLHAAPRDGAWEVRLRDKAEGREWTARARFLVNAGGPWAGGLLARLGRPDARDPLRLVKGSHIIVPRLAAHEQAYILQNTDRRILFIIPYEGRFSLIGTTEEAFDGDPRSVAISDDEKVYLVTSVNRYLRVPLGLSDIVWSYSGVRPLMDGEGTNATRASRDYKLMLERVAGAPMLSVLGGKITTYREMADKAVDGIVRALGCHGQRWTRDAPLPGGDMEGADFNRFFERQRTRYPWLGEATCRRLARAYGTSMDKLLEGARALADLGPAIAGDLRAAEVAYLQSEEFARTPEDILWRRSKLGLHLPADAPAKLASYMA
ncbi:MAG: glycerol-3-phosphate dehydrogenase [Pseudomonadota bacterium]